MKLDSPVCCPRWFEVRRRYLMAVARLAKQLFVSWHLGAVTIPLSVAVGLTQE